MGNPIRQRSRTRAAALLSAALALVATGVLPGTADAAINASTYDFTTGSASLESMTGSTPIIGAANDDNNSAAIPIGFDFVLDGVRYDSFSANTNGFLRLGQALASGASPWVNTYDAAFANYPVVAPYHDDMFMSFSPDARVHYRLDTSGGAGNHRLIVEWLGPIAPYSSTTGTTSNVQFQAILSQNGTIEYRYGTMPTGAYSVGGGFGVAGYTVGFATSSTNMVTLTTPAGSPSYAAPSVSISTTNPVAGSFYRFTPLNATGAVTGAAVSATGSATAPTLTLNWTNPTGAHTGTMIFRSEDGGTTYRFLASKATTGAGAADSFVVTGVGNASTYHFRLVPFAEGTQGAATVISGATLAGTRSGAVTVSGGASPNVFPDFSNLANAMADLNANGLSGNVTIELGAGYDGTTEAAPLALTALAGPGATVTIRPATGTTHTIGALAGTGGNATVRFDGSDWITINGDAPGGAVQNDLTIRNLNTATTANTSAVLFTNDASFNTVQNVNIQFASAGAPTAATPVAGMLFTGTAAGGIGNDNNSVTACAFDGRGTAHTLLFSASALTNRDAWNSGNTVQNSDFFDNFVAAAASGTVSGISLLEGSTNWTIDGNDFFQTTARTATGGSTHMAIRADVAASATVPAALGFTITNNRFGAAAGGTVATNSIGGAFANRWAGIGFAAGGGTSTISGNQFGAIALNTTATAATSFGAFAPIAIGGNAGASVTGAVNVTGNTVGSATTPDTLVVTSNAAAPNIRGISSTSRDQVTIDNNTIAGLTARTTSGTNGLFLAAIYQRFGTGSLFTTSNNTVGTAASGILGTSTIATTGNIVVRGFDNETATGRIQVSGNTFRNLAASAFTGVPGTGSQVIGIQNRSANGFLIATGNTIENLRNPANNSGTGTTAAAIGIIQSAASHAQTVRSNTISNLQANGTPAATQGAQSVGILMTSTTTASPAPVPNVVERNLIHSFSTTSTGSGTTAPQMVGIFASTGINSTYQNNMVRLGIDNAGASQTDGDLLIQGIRDVSSNAARYYHNSVYIGGAGVDETASDQNTFAFVRSTAGASSVTTLTNNIFVNERSNASAGGGTHQATGFFGSTALADANLNANGNLYHGTGTGFGFSSTGTAFPTAVTPYATLAAFQAAFPTEDAASIFGTPSFAAATAATPDLHIGAAPSFAEAAGVALPAVTDDFDGQTRAGLSPVDIGADAGNFTLIDLTGPALTYTAYTDTQSTTGIRTLSVSITDQTGLETSGGNGPRLYYRKGTIGAFSFVNATSVTGSGPFTATFDLDQGPLALVAGDVVQYYVAAQDTVTVPAPNASTSPSGGSGINPPGTTAPGSPAQYTILDPPLAGDYLVGASQTSPNFTNLTQATAAFNGRGVSAPVRFLLQADYDSATETFPISFNVPSPGPAPTSTNTVTVKPGTGVTEVITGSSNSNGVINVLSDYVGIDGSNTNGGTTRDLSIINTATTTAPMAVWYRSSAAGTLDGGFVRNTILRGGINTGAVGATGVVLTLDGAGGAGVFNNFDMVNNDVARVRQALFTNLAAGSADLTIEDNVAISTGADALGDIGFLVQGAISGVLVRGNEVANIDGTSGFNDRGIWVTAGPTNVVVEENIVRNINNTNAGGWGAWGISSSTGTSSVTIRNNFIRNINALGFSLTGGTNFAESDNSIGIAIWGTASSAAIHNNSVFLTGNTQTGGATMGITLATGTTADLRNNIVENNSGTASGTPGAYALWATTGESQILATSNNNNYRVTATGAGTRAIARLAAADQATLANYQAAVAAGGRETASLSVDPLFVSATDLHLNCGSPMVAAGTTIPVLTSDIDGDTRLSPPDIGADESLQPRTPADQPTALAATASSCDTLGVSWTAASSAPSGYIVIRRAGAAPTGAPDAVRTTGYNVGDTIGDGTVAYVGAATSFNDSALAGGTYHYAAFSFNGAPGCQRFRTASPATASGDVVAEPTAQATALTSPAQTTSSIDVSWTAASPAPTGYIVLAVPGTTAPSDVPADGVTYAVNDPIGASVVVFAGAGTSFTHSGLPADTDFAYAVFTFNTGTGCTNYLTTAPLTGTFSTTAISNVNEWSVIE